MKRYTIIAIILFCSCQKTVTLKLNTAPAQLVIQGEVTNATGPYTVTINQSVGFYNDNTFPAVSGAVVKISDDQGLTDSLTETFTPGVYTTHTLQGTPGHTYTLSVTALQQQYNATSTMPAPVNLDYIDFQVTTGFGKSRIDAVANFQDPAGIHNYYQFVQYINGTLFNKNIYVYDDRLSDGKYINYTLRTDSSYIQKGDQMEIRMYCIDENVYNYIFQLSLVSGNGAFNTSASPGNPGSNISNGAYGYFSAHTTQSQFITVN